MKNKLLVFVAALLPLAQMAWLVTTHHLGPDPAVKLSHITGEWAIRFLLFTLLVSSLSRVQVKFRFLLKVRRMLGLYAFFYAVIHLLVFVVLYLGFDATVLLSEVKKRPYITVGMLAWLLMLPLAVTSNQWMLRKLGGNKWKLLHRLVYPCLLLVIIHVIWQVRSSWFDAVLYGFCAVALLMERMGSACGRNRSV